MSEEIGEITTRDNEGNQRSIYLTSFYGGEKRGRCLQITVSTPFGAEYAQLTNNDAVELCEIIDAWINPEYAEAEAAQLKQRAEQAEADAAQLRDQLKQAKDELSKCQEKCSALSAFGEVDICKKCGHYKARGYVCYCGHDNSHEV